MTSRIWADGPTGNTPLTAAMMNGIESDLDARVQKGGLAFHVSDYGAVGDGVTDDTTAITNAAAAATAAGRLLVFNGTKRYRLTGSVTFSGLSLQTNNCTFVKSENNATYYIKIGDNIRADKLKLEIAGGGANDAGIYVNGSNISIDSIEVTTLTADQVGPNALLVGDLTLTNPAKTNIRIRHIALTGFRSPMRTINIDGCRFSNITISNFSTGVYVIDTRNTVFDKASVTGTSPSSNGSPGQNAMLMEAQSADYSCSNIRFEDWLSDGSPEHAFRIGGSFSAKDIHFTNCVARNTGNAPGNVATGGSGFKAVGLTGGHWHINIFYTNCVVEDANTNGSGTNNFTGFNMNFVKNLVLTNPVVRAQNNVYSAQVALYLNSIDTASVVNPMFKDTKSSCIFIARDSTDSSLQGVQNVRIVGGHAGCNSASTAIAVRFDTQESITKNVFIEDLTVSAGSMALRQETPTTVGANTGAYTNIFAKMRYINAPTASTSPPVGGGNYCILDYSGPIYGSFGIPGMDGSFYLDTGTGKRYIRKATTWVQQ